MQIGIMEGSLRKASLSRTVGRNAQDLAPENVDMVHLPSLGDMPLYNQDIQDAGMPKAVTQQSEAIDSVDALLIVSPEYNWSIPGVLKNGIDWLSRLKPNPLEGKPVAIWTVAPGLLGGARAHQAIRQVLSSQGMVIMAKPEVQVAGAKGKVDVEAGSITSEDTADFLRSHLQAFVDFSRRWNS